MKKNTSTKKVALITILLFFTFILSGCFHAEKDNQEGGVAISESEKANNQQKVPATEKEESAEEKVEPKKEYRTNTVYTLGKELFYNGGKVENAEPGGLFSISGNDFVYKRKNDKHLIFNGKDYGIGVFPIVSKGNISFCRYVSSDGEYHHIFNDEDLGLSDCANERSISGKNYAFLKKVGTKKYVIHNGKNLGEGLSASVYGEDIVYSDKSGNLIYNGKNLGRGFDPVLSETSIAYAKRVGNNNDSHIIFNGEDLGLGIGPKLSGKNLAYFRYISPDYDKEIVYNGEVVGEGWSVVMWGDKIAFETKDNHVIYNGEDMGSGFGVKIAEDDIIFLREVGRKIEGKNQPRHIIYNGEDLGEGGNHLVTSKFE